IPARATREAIETELVRWTVGRRLTSDAISRPGRVAGDVADNAARRTAARTRQSAIDTATRKADALAELDELAAMRATPDALRERVDALTDVFTATELRSLRTAATSPAKLAAAVDRL